MTFGTITYLAVVPVGIAAAGSVMAAFIAFCGNGRIKALCRRVDELGEELRTLTEELRVMTGKRDDLAAERDDLVVERDRDHDTTV